MTLDNDVTFKFLEPETLADLLQQIPDGCVVCPNAVGNLAIYKREGDDNFTFIGFVDFLHDGEIEYTNSNEKD